MVKKNVLLCFVEIVNFSGVHFTLRAHKSTGPLCVCSELKIRQVKDPTCSQGCSVAKFAM